ncbi:hypothetical protein ONS96_000946 [Cadophora gregata f. sp. sojae]|nr:hypothetical protein ONS96_000946 [Cadophora gregata f. sp. sojae]
MSDREAEEEIDRTFEAMIRKLSEGSFHIRIIGGNISTIDRKVVAWSVCRDEWEVWRDTWICHNLIRQYIRSGFTPIEAEVRAILLYLECNEPKPGDGHNRPGRKEVRVSSKGILHNHYQSLREQWHNWGRKSTDGDNRLNCMAFDEAQRLDRAIMPVEQLRH